MSYVSTMKIAIIDDHPLLREGLSAVFENHPDIEIVAQGKSANDALSISLDLCPDVILLDLGIPGGGLEALKEITQRAPSVKCVMLTVCDCAETAITALNSGARGYILKGVGANELVSALWKIMRDESFVSPEFATRLLQAAQTKAAPDPVIDVLSYRESQIMRELENGSTNRQIAEKLQISEKTVKYYMSAIMQKYGVSNRVSAVIAAQKSRGSRPHGYPDARV